MEANTSFGLTQIGQIAITVRDLDRAVTFYRTQLGMHYPFSTPTLAFFDCNGVRLILSTPEPATLDHSSSVLYYKVDALQTAYQILVERGSLRRYTASHCCYGHV